MVLNVNYKNLSHRQKCKHGLQMFWWRRSCNETTISALPSFFSIFVIFDFFSLKWTQTYHFICFLPSESFFQLLNQLIILYRQTTSDKIFHIFSQVLFIGDSTNRGILHYILERLNGTLVQWDKTHNIRIYPDLNDNQTVFGFAYYPQFWLMSQQRPMFDKVFSHLINR